MIYWSQDTEAVRKRQMLLLAGILFLALWIAWAFLVPLERARLPR